MKCFLLQRFEGPTLKKQGFPFPIEVTFSLLGLSNGCGEHCDKFSLATESLHVYVNFLTFPSRGPWSRCLLIDLCSIIFSCHFTQNPLEKKWQWFNEIHEYCSDGQEVKACLNLNLLS